MRGPGLVLITILLFSQIGMVRERKAEYAHEAHAVLSFLDREFWDREAGGYFSNPYGKPIKPAHEQALVALAHLLLYNATGEKRHLYRATELLDFLSDYEAPSGGYYRVAREAGPFHTQEQSIILRTLLEAYRTTGKPEYRTAYRRLADFILKNLCHHLDGREKVLSWWDAENNASEDGQYSMDYFQPALAFFEAYSLEENQSYLNAAKSILVASERFWDENNYGYSHSTTDTTRYSRDQVTGALAYLSAYDITSRKDYLQRARDVLFYLVSRMGDQLSRTFYEAMSFDGKIEEPRRKRTADHLLMVQAYLLAYKVTLEDKFLHEGEDLLDAVMNRAYDASSAAFTDQVGGAVMGDLEVQAYGAITLAEAYKVLTVGPSPIIAIIIIGVLVGLVGFLGYLFKRSWPY